MNVDRQPELFPDAGFWVAAIILTMPVRDVALGTVGRANIRIGDVVLAVAVTIWLASSLMRRRMRVQMNGLDWTLAAFVGMVAVSIIWGVWYDAAIVRILKLGRNLMLYALIVNYLRIDFEAGLRRIGLCLVVSGLMQSAAFVYSMWERGGLEGWREIMEATSLASSDPRLRVVKGDNGAGIFLRGASSWLPLCAFFGWAVAPRMRTALGRSTVRAMAAAMIVLTVLSLSRGAWMSLVGAGIAMLFAAGLFRSFRRAAIAAPVVAVVLLAGWHEPLTNLVRSRMGTSFEQMMADPSVQDRLYYFGLAIDSFERSPLVGGGVAAIDSSEYIIVHNAYLQVLGELGLIGAILFGFVLWKWWRYLMFVRRHSRRAEDRLRRTTTLAMFGVTAFFLTYFLSAHDLESSEPWLVMAACSALYASTRRAHALRARLAAPGFALEPTGANAPS